MHERELQIVFEPIEHVYSVNGETGFSSVTEKLKLYFEPFRKDFIISRVLKKKDCNMSFDEIAADWKARANFGTSVHDAIETWLLLGTPPKNPTIDLAICFAQFLNFWKHLNLSHPIKSWRPEMRIFSETFKIAGSIDLVVEFQDGTIEIFDWKCVSTLRKSGGWSNGKPPFDKYPDTNFTHYTIQLNLYKFILEAHYDMIISKTHLVQLHYERATWKLETLPDIQDDIKAMLNPKIQQRKPEFLKLNLLPKEKSVQ